MQKFIANKLLCCALTFLLCSVASADPGNHREDRHWRGDIHRFHERDSPRWHQGHWVHDVHNGHLGWWWIIGASWYFYPAPVDPYSDPYTPPVFLQQQPAATVEQESAPPEQNWYYCSSAKAYYPYVSSCREGWKIVPATPSQ